MLVEFLAVEADDAVATAFLCHVQRIVGGPNERIAVGDARVRPARDPEACTPPNGEVVEGECMSLDLFPHPFTERHRGVEHGAGEEHHELLTAISADAVDLARLV